MNEFEEGLQLGRLHPSHMISFLQGLSRRVNERMVAAARSVPSGEATASILKAMQDSLAVAAIRLKETGFSPDHDLEDLSPQTSLAEPKLEAIHTGALEVARRISGMPDATWSEKPELLDQMRSTCADLAAFIRTIEVPEDPKEA